ncbi:MAG TPA: S53 family serine peptidase [Verrucomicrobiae bacterium]|nr:S53 family serine peptidase [Verrucomicrobiae bacterium]
MRQCNPESRPSWWIIAILCVFGFITPGLAADRQVLHKTVPAAVANLGLQPIGRLPGATNLRLVIGLPLRNQSDFNQLLHDLYDPTSFSYHQYLTPQQITKKFGPTEEDYQAVVDFVRTNGFAVTRTHSDDRTLLDVNASVADIERLLHVTMRVYQHPTEARTFYAPDAEPSLDIAVPLAGISGLNNYIVPRPGGGEGIPSVRASGAAPGSGTGPGSSYWGNDFRAAYVPGVSLTGSGQVVGLLELDGYYTNDIAAYEHLAGVPNVPITNVLVEGFDGVPDGNRDWVGEVSLDIEMVISMAPGLSKVIVYESPNCCNYWVDILRQMQQDNAAKQLSCSWLFDYDDPVAEPIYRKMAMQGQSFFQCSGDYLAFYNGVPQWTDDANVTLVGGTMLTTTASGTWASETTWNNGDGTIGSGGGISASYLGNVPIPYWQQGLDMTANQGSATMRNVPDVSMVAYYAWVIWDNGSSNWWWGTSIAAPLWAGFTALVNQQAALNGQAPVGFINPAVYSIGKGSAYNSCFHDVTTGDNINSHSSGLFSAAPGYDLCTGWGSPTGSNLISALLSTTAFQAWQTQYFGSTTNPVAAATADADGTGQNNQFKYVAGLNPTSPASVFALSISATNPSPRKALIFNPLASGRTYTPQFTTNLPGGNWQPLTTYTGPVTNGSRVSITDTNPISPQEFYRLDILLP